MVVRERKTRERESGGEGGVHFIAFFMMYASMAEQRRPQTTATTQA